MEWDIIKIIGKGIIKRIFLAFIIFALILFAYINSIYSTDVQSGNRKFAETSLEKLIDEKSTNVENILRQFEFETENIGAWLEYELNDSVELKNEEIKYIEENYYINSKNIITRKLNQASGNLINEKENSNVFFSNREIWKDEYSVDLIATLKLEDKIKTSYERLPDAEYIYIITNYNLIRIYPFEKIDNFEYGHDFSKDVYYNVVDQTKPDNIKPLWTEPYVDYLYNGWVITCSYPVYNNDGLKAVVSIDLDVDELRKSILDLSIDEKGEAFLIDENGDIIFHSGISVPFSNKDKGSIFNSNILDTAKSKNEYKSFNKMISDSNNEGVTKLFDDSGDEELLIYKNIEGMGWKIGVIVDSAEYLAEQRLVSGGTSKFLIFSFVLIMIFLIYFYNYLSKPLLKLMKEIVNMGKTYGISSVEYSEENEIKLLNETFISLKDQLDLHINNLSRKNKELEIIFKNFPGTISIHDLDYNVIMYNDSEFNYNLREDHSKCYDIFFGRSEICPNCPVVESIKTKEICNHIIKNKDKIYSISSFPVFDKDNNITEIIVHRSDITEKIVKDMERENSERFSAIGQLAAGVTHELKNNLSIMKGSHYLLSSMSNKNFVDTKILNEILQDFSISITDSENIISSLLGFSNKDDKSDGMVDVISIIDQILMLKKSHFLKYNIKVIKRYDLESIKIKANSNSLKFIVVNIISNALDAMKEKGNMIEIRVFVNQIKEKRHLHINISDNGPGILDDERNNIFNPFITTKADGSGLGLWIAKNHVDNLNGHIYVESKYGEGTKFIVVLPID